MGSSFAEGQVKAMASNAKGSKDKGQGEGISLIASNRRARHDYFIEETYEAGIELTGTEIKSVRAGKVSLVDSFATVEGGEVIVRDLHISPYDYGNRFNHDPMRPRRLLLHKEEIRKIAGKVRERGYTLVPLRMYFKRGWAKLELAVAKGKKSYDKRADIAERDARREAERAMKVRF